MLNNSQIAAFCKEHYEAGEIVAGWLLVNAENGTYCEQPIRRFGPREKETYLLRSVNCFKSLANSIAEQNPHIDVPEKIARKLRRAIQYREKVQDHHRHLPNKTPEDIKRYQRHEHAIRILKEARDALGISPDPQPKHTSIATPTAMDM